MRRTTLGILLLPALVSAQNLDKFSQQLGQLGAKTPVTEISLISEPADGRVRPFETLAIRLQAWGEQNGAKVRLRRTGATFRVVEPNGGWVSKPFAWQGQDDAKYLEESSNAAWNIFTEASGRFTIKDSVLYTAPEAPGKYTVQATFENRQATLTVTVSGDAPSRVKAETVTFPPAAPSNDPYRRLAEHYAPFVAQETWFQPKADIPTRFDYDGDWDGDNNWDSLETGTSQAYVHYAVMETATHWFIHYNLFHPRDYSDRCVIGTCHENDNEGLILTVRKDGSEFGRLQVMQTLAHNNVYTFTADRNVRGGAHSVAGAIDLYEGSHPAVFVESGGHGIYGAASEHSRYSLAKDEFLAGTGITLIYKGKAERPRHANDRLTGYDLLPIYDEWWAKAVDPKWTPRTFDAPFEYRPFGGRPGLAAPIGGCFFGRKEAEDKAKPFWGWHDTTTLKKRILNVGQWALDPAYAVSQTLRFPANDAVSLDYTFNPYLGVGTPAVRAGAGPVVQPAAEAEKTPRPPLPVLTAAALARQAPAQSAQTVGAAGNAGEAEIVVRVDGTVDLFVYGSEVRCEVVAGASPALDKATFTGPVPAAAVTSFTVTKKEGRGKVTLLEQPAAANNFGARIRIEDPKSGADTYRIAIRWQ